MEMGSEFGQNPTRVQNLSREAQRLLLERQPNQDSLSQWTRPLEALLEDREFWAHQKRGFVAFLSPDRFEHYEVWLEVPELVRVGERFHTSPLLPLLGESERSLLLVLSQHGLRMFECFPGRCLPIEMPKDMPQNIQESDRFEDEVGPARGQVLEHRSGRSGGFAGASGSSHGIGVKNEVLEESRLRFLRRVNQSLMTFLSDQSVPLILAGVDDLVHGFRKELSYAGVLAEHISGNFEHSNADELLEKAGPVANRHFEQTKRAAAEDYRLALGSQRASSDLDEVWPAVVDGRVAKLLVSRGQNVWGTTGQDGRSLERQTADHPLSYDLLDLAASQTLEKGGLVLVLDAADMPEPSSPVSAIFRY